jgi:membrane protease subunit HflC
MNNKIIVWLIIAGAAIILLSNSLYRVMEFERVVVLRFGALHQSDVPPGLRVKVPLIDEVRRFDGRVLTADAAPENFYTIAKKRLEVDSYAKWRIADVDAYYRTTGGREDRAENRLEARINDGLRNEFGRRTLSEVVSGERDQLMENLTNDLNSVVRETLGIEVLDVRVKKIDLPREVSDSVFNRMAAERRKLADEYRAQGQEESEKIRAQADREVTILEAEAYRDAERLRGEGDAQAAAIYAEAFGRNPEFYSFTRSLRAYTESFAGREDMLVLDPDSDFFKYLDQPTGRR